MKKSASKLRLGVVGCGAIGSRIALSTMKELKGSFLLTALFDIDAHKAVQLSRQLKLNRVVKESVDELLKSSDVVVECVNTEAAEHIIRKALQAQKKVLVMSVGRLFGKNSLFLLTRQQKATLVLPSGAIAGLDAVKAAALAGIKSITLITRKPPSGFQGNAFLIKRGVILNNITSDTILFDGSVKDAVARFPQNINVAASLAFAAEGARVRVKIIASPSLTKNIHEVICEGKGGIIRAITENVPCPDNPKTSYLAVLSGIQALKQLADKVKIGT